jgi:hypothetical protein
MKLSGYMGNGPFRRGAKAHQAHQAHQEEASQEESTPAD